MLLDLLLKKKCLNDLAVDIRDKSSGTFSFHSKLYCFSFFRDFLVLIIHFYYSINALKNFLIQVNDASIFTHSKVF
jgi:hypothetical protein